MGREEWECDKWGQEWGAVANTSSNSYGHRREGGSGRNRSTKMLDC